jgi:hypothetical protein
MARSSSRRSSSSVWPWVVGIGLFILLAESGGKRVHKTLTRKQLVDLARKVGFPEGEVERAAEIAMRESGGNPNVVNDTRGRSFLPPGTTVENSWGLWQINRLAWPRFSEDELSDPEGNARAALSIWKLEGWAPWSTAKTLPPSARKSEPPAPDDDFEP